MGISRRIEKIAVVCNGGMGSSAMGAALLRRTLAGEQLTGLKVAAYAVDLIPEDTDLVVCQADYYRLYPGKYTDREVYTVENLLDKGEFLCLADEIRKRNGW